MVNKGSKLYIKGKLQTKKWQDNSGQDRYTTEVIVNGFGGVMTLLDSPNNQQQQQQQQRQQRQQRPANHPAQQAPQRNQYQAAQNGQPAPQQGQPNQYDQNIPY